LRDQPFGLTESAKFVCATFSDDVFEDRRVKRLVEFHPCLTLFDPSHLGMQWANLSDAQRDCVPYLQSPDDIVELASVFGQVFD
tara:strand:- start:292 stop:543 length:252 start_codon:yes stop_codon:yes gene_type:complete